MKRQIVYAFMVVAILLGGHYLLAALPADRVYLFTYSLTLKNIPPGAQEVRIWIPYPAETSYQKVRDLNPDGVDAYSARRDGVYSNRMLYYVIKSPRKPVLSISRAYKIRRSEFANKPAVGQAGSYDSRGVPKTLLRRYLAEDGFVVITPQVRELASEISEGKTGDVGKARAFYDYLFEHMTYDKTEPGWGQGDIERVCRLWKGNCTDFHSLFVALCRAVGIPAKFVMGVPFSDEASGTVKGYHCWAEFYASGYGWVPVDISEAWKNKNRYEYFFGAVDAGRIELSHGRGIRLSPPQQGEPLNYFVYPYVEIDGKPFTDVETVFSYEEPVDDDRERT